MSCSLFLLKSEILDCRAVTSEKKGQFCKDFFGIFEILDDPFLSEHFQKSIYNRFFSPIVSCRLYSCNFIKKELHYLCFRGYFPKILVQLFPNTVEKSTVTEFSRVLGCRLQSRVLIKKWLHQRWFLEFFWRWNYTHKKVYDGIQFWSQSAMFLRTDLFHDMIIQFIVKNIMLKARSNSLQF